jgi:formylglycine-generating enzyme required for sulfatase activity
MCKPSAGKQPKLIVHRLYCILSIIIVLFTVFSAACSRNTPAPAAAAPTESRAIAPITLASPVSITPVVTAEVSPAVHTTPIRPANTPLPAATIDRGPACTEIGQTWTSPVDGVTLVCVPAGTFLMGAAANDPLAQDHEKPQHRVYLDAFWIDRTEVTNANFAKCLAAGVCRPKVYELSAKTYTPYAIHPDYQNFPALL